MHKIINIIGIIMIVCCCIQVMKGGIFGEDKESMELVKEPHSIYTLPVIDTVEADEYGNFYVSNYDRNIIQVFNHEGKFLRGYDCNNSLQDFYIDEHNFLHIVVGRGEFAEYVCNGSEWDYKARTLNDQEMDEVYQLRIDSTYYQGNECTIWGRTVHVGDHEKIKLQAPVFPVSGFIMMPAGILVLIINDLIRKISRRKDR